MPNPSTPRWIRSRQLDVFQFRILCRKKKQLNCLKPWWRRAARICIKCLSHSIKSNTRHDVNVAARKTFFFFISMTFCLSHSNDISNCVVLFVIFLRFFLHLFVECTFCGVLPPFFCIIFIIPLFHWTQVLPFALQDCQLMFVFSFSSLSNRNFMRS